VQALDALEDFPSGDQLDAITVFHRNGALTAADRARIDAARAALNEKRRKDVGLTGPAAISKDGTTALLVTPITIEEATSKANDLLLDSTDDIRAQIADLPPGLEAKITGPAGFSADAIDVFGNINGTLLFATAGLVLLLLIAIYRSPIFWAIPFVAVLIAETSARGFGYLLAEAGVTITGQSGGILPVLVFGAGTDYALLMVSRYREELRRHEDKHDAIRVTLQRTSPVILASGATVMAALLTLSLAEVNGTAGLGPIGAMGIGLAMVAMLTLLPALP
jgi:RND superfamily putative drug exporter